ncbi:Hypothetical predicted protein [Lecanosticta acicola]|uniref:LysM domain-containing protein n=1 Tax=Lecanosticta acicola TaxID=111012 RepID=A0AAI8Z5D1_9PEZI|nr:Hypothetical predicted protein [Lecanosticta acicola]
MQGLVFLAGLLTAVNGGALLPRTANYPDPQYMPSGSGDNSAIHPSESQDKPLPPHSGGGAYPPPSYSGGGSGGSLSNPSGGPSGSGGGGAGYSPSSNGGSDNPSQGGSGSAGSGSGGSASGLICGASDIVDHIVVKGDTLGKLAHQFNTGICDIANLNNIANPNLIITGTTLHIPENCANPDNTTCHPDQDTTPTEVCVLGLPGTYTVKSGDTLNQISKNFNITLQSLEGANTQISNFDVITPGELINLPICPNSQCENVGTYTIQNGDLFVDLAKKYGTTIGQIEALNENADPEQLQPGMVIVLPQGCRNLTEAVA